MTTPHPTPLPRKSGSPDLRENQYATRASPGREGEGADRASLNGGAHLKPLGTEAQRPYLSLQGLSKVYATRDGAVRALDQVSVSEKRGKFLSIVGPSGCGK